MYKNYFVKKSVSVQYKKRSLLFNRLWCITMTIRKNKYMEVIYSYINVNRKIELITMLTVFVRDK